MFITFIHINPYCKISHLDRFHYIDNPTRLCAKLTHDAADNDNSHDTTEKQRQQANDNQH
ncbi:MAG TPA: hypothetical protein PKM65_09405 [Spirochaetota bacterium]|nr:hypothetical protein [Spirochaetota bacterium]HNT12755.1 hypothetical protein [Spirochaetota bacterium]